MIWYYMIRYDMICDMIYDMVLYDKMICDII